MRKQIISVALVGGLGAGALAVAVPGIATAADTAASTAASGVADRTAHIRDALKGLVTNGTITQAQADKVASTLATQLPPPGFGGRGHGPDGGRLPADAVAKALGITVDELRTAQESGKTLAQIAATKNISKADLISKLVAAAKAQLAADVTAGRITQAQSDAVSNDLTAHITDMVDRVGPPPGGHRHGPDGDADDTAPAPAAPSSTTSSSATSSAGA